MSSGLSASIQKQLRSGVAILQKGGVIAFPTDTIYALAAAFDNAAAVERIYKLKKRPHSMGLPLLVADERQLEEVTAEIPPAAGLLIKEFMPGALTLVLKKAEAAPEIITGGADTVAVRIPAHPAAIAIIKGLGKPVTGTSANISGKPNALTAAEVRLQFGDSLDLIIDGECTGEEASTILDVSGISPKILRKGAIPRRKLEQVIDIKE